MASLATGQDKSSIISALVSQMKAGSISKNDLFEQLSKLHRGGNTGPNADDIQEEETPAPIEQPNAKTPSAEESVRRLVDEKRRERMAAADTNAALDTKQREQITIDELMSQSQSSEPTSTTTTTHNNNNNNTRSNQTNQHNRTNGQRGNPHASGGRGYSTPSRTTTKRRSNTSVAKSGRHERREEELRNDAMSECTFQPKITKLPASYGAARSYVKENFHSRVMKWKETREKSLAQRREDNVLEEMDNCTFKPEVNAPGFRSHRAVSTPRGRTSQSSERSTAKNVVERLYSTQRKATRTAEAELKRSREEEFNRTLANVATDAVP